MTTQPCRNLGDFAHPGAARAASVAGIRRALRLLSAMVPLALLLFPPPARCDISSSDLFLAPSAVPTAIYDPIVIPFSQSGGSYDFSTADVPGATQLLGLHILPVLNADPNTTDGAYTLSDLNAINVNNYQTYYGFDPGVDYSATTISGNSSLVSFSGNADGMYMVELVTSNGATTSDHFFRVDFGDALGEDPAGGVRDATGANRRVTLPDTALTIISDGDPNDNNYLKNAQKQLPNAVKATTVQQVVDAIKNYYDAHGKQKFEVTIIGHGRAGSIKIGTQRINDQGDTNGGMTPSDFQKAIDQYVSSVHFFSCNTGTGAAGSQFLNEIAASIPVVTAYNGPTTASQKYFDVGATTQLVNGSDVATPEPSALLYVLSGAPPLFWYASRRRRPEPAGRA